MFFTVDITKLMVQMPTEMRNILLSLILIFSSGILCAQTPPDNLYGAEFRAWVKANYYTGEFVALSYAEARIKLYTRVASRNDSIECVYSGLLQYHSPSDNNTALVPFNTEHVVPQSLFSSAGPMKSDIHILQPAYEDWNTLRSNFPYQEIPDNQTQQWIYLLSSTSPIPVSNIDQYSESKASLREPMEVVLESSEGQSETLGLQGQYFLLLFAKDGTLIAHEKLFIMQ